MERKQANRFLSRFKILNQPHLRSLLLWLIVFLCVIVGVWLIGEMAILHLVEKKVVTDELFIGKLELLNNFVFGGMGGLCVFLFAILFLNSQSIPGPIHNLEKTLEKMKRGDLRVKLIFRKGDELHQTATVFNEALNSIRLLIQEDRDFFATQLHELEEIGRSLKKIGRNEEAIQLLALVSEIKKTEHHIKI